MINININMYYYAHTTHEAETTYRVNKTTTNISVFVGSQVLE